MRLLSLLLQIEFHANSRTWCTVRMDPTSKQADQPQ